MISKKHVQDATGVETPGVGEYNTHELNGFTKNKIPNAPNFSIGS